MTASSTRCCRRRSWLALLAALWLALALPRAGARARGHRRASGAALVAAEDGYYLEATFDDRAHPHARGGAQQGRAALFPARVRADTPALVLVRREGRQRAAAATACPTTRSRASTASASARCYQNFPTLAEALEFLSRVRLRDIARAGALQQGQHLYRGAAHAARHLAAAEAVPDHRARLARLEHRLGLVRWTVAP